MCVVALWSTINEPGGERIVLQCVTWSVCCWRNWGGRETESPARWGAPDGCRSYSDAHWTAKRRKWAAGSQIWQEVSSERWDGWGCVCARASNSHRPPTTAGDSFTRNAMMPRQICLHTWREWVEKRYFVKRRRLIFFIYFLNCNNCL